STIVGSTAEDKTTAAIDSIFLNILDTSFN
ncbi:MAG: hypothetical protein ACI9N9_002094, partial [Enterobacterales bacterium]